MSIVDIHVGIFTQEQQAALALQQAREESKSANVAREARRARAFPPWIALYTRFCAMLTEFWPLYFPFGNMLCQNKYWGYHYYCARIMGDINVCCGLEICEVLIGCTGARG